MGQLSNQTAIEDARQIFRITRIECDQPLERIEALVLGDAPCTEPLAEALRKAGAAVACLADPPEQGERYDLVVLLRGIEPRTLGELTRPGALVVDACRAKNSEWVLYDPALHYRRIRVISMAGL